MKIEHEFTSDLPYLFKELLYVFNIKEKTFNGSEDIDIRDWYLHLLIFMHYNFELLSIYNDGSTIDFDVDIPGYEVAWKNMVNHL